MLKDETNGPSSIIYVAYPLRVAGRQTTIHTHIHTLVQIRVQLTSEESHTHISSIVTKSHG